MASPTNNWLSRSLVTSCTIGSQGGGNTIPRTQGTFRREYLYQFPCAKNVTPAPPIPTYLATCATFPVIIQCYLFPAMRWRGPVLGRWAWSQDTFPGSNLVGLFARIAPRLFSAIHDSLIWWGWSALWLSGGKAFNLCLPNSTQAWSASESMWVHLLSLSLLLFSQPVF